MHQIALRGFGPGDFATGDHDGTEVRDGGLVIVKPTRHTAYRDPHRDDRVTDFESARWTSPVVTAPFAFGDLVASWSCTTPPETWIEVEARARRDDGEWSGWMSLGRWTMSEQPIMRTSVPGQRDDVATVLVDTLRSRGGTILRLHQVHVTLHRLPGSTQTPHVRRVAVMVSTSPAADDAGTVTRGRTAADSPRRPGSVIDVPAFSQELYRDRLPHLNGGGQTWCSPTSTAMVLAAFGHGPSGAQLAEEDTHHPHPEVVHAVRHTFDGVYQAGNWPFNTAYASEFGLDAFVTRLHGLDEAETFIAAGIPLVASLTFADGELTGSGYGTGGHLLVIVGFTDEGDVVVNDPASHLVPDDSQVRTVYRRDEFQDAWMRVSQGLVYVIHPPEVPLPPLLDDVPHW